MSDGDVTIEGTLTESSDSRLKRGIADSSLGLDFVNALQPREYRRVDGVRKHYGFIAQEVKAAIDAHSEIADGHNIWSEDPDGTQQLAQGNLVPMLVKAIQELSAQNESLQAQINELKEKLK